MTRIWNSSLGAWNRFWFAPAPTSTLAVLRIAYGVMGLAYAVSLRADLGVFFFREGLLPAPPQAPWGRGILSVFSSDAAVISVFVMLIAGSLGLIFGFHSRLAAVAVFVALLTFHRRNVFVFNSGDGLLRIEGLFLALAPAGASLSLDSRRKASGGAWHFPLRSPWALRLLQVQISILYASTVWSKLRGVTWNDGSAVSYALRISNLTRFSLPDSVTTSLILSNVATYGTLLIEASLAVLVWNRKARPVVLLLGVLLHVSIDLTLLTGFFSWAIFLGYIAFIPEDSMARWLESRRVQMAKWKWLRLRQAKEVQI